jgi:hypothetical protein
MSNERAEFREQNEDFPSEALSNEVLKRMFDDLFQEIETIKQRVTRLEVRSAGGGAGETGGSRQAKDMVSDPDR